MACWKDFEDAAPEIAAAGKKLLYQFGLGLAFLATLRKDGAPRLHPICPMIYDGKLCALIGPSYKRADLIRDGRYALHTFPSPEKDDEFLLMGLRLAEGIDPARYARLAGRPLDPRRIVILHQEGAIETTPDGRLRVTRAGFPVLDAVVADLAA